jgi:hypothetical protein
MLERERKRATWSLALGATFSLLIFAGGYWWAHSIQKPLAELVPQCDQRGREKHKFKNYDDALKDLQSDPNFARLSDDDRKEVLRWARQSYIS